MPCQEIRFRVSGPPAKERDAETGNDDFGARYYSNRFGRWLSADWSSVPVPVPYANLTNPQTLNLYAMVADDPESFADLDGHIEEKSQGGAEGQCGGGTGNTGGDTCAKQRAQQAQAAQQKQSVTITSTEGTATTNPDGSVHVVQTTTTATFSTKKGEEGKFLTATSQTVSYDVSAGSDHGRINDITNYHAGEVKEINFGQATKAMGAERMAAGVEAAVPGFATHLLRNMGLTVWNHPVKFGIGAGATIGGAIAIGVAPGTQYAGWKMLAGGLTMLGGLATDACAAGEYAKCN